MSKKFVEMHHNLVIDFDGTICEWGEYPEPGKPKHGVREALQELKDLGFNLLIASARTSDEVSKYPIDKRIEKERMEKYLNEHKIPYDEVLTSNKFPATFYIDDRAIEFKDNWGEITQRIKKGGEDDGIYSYSEMTADLDELDSNVIDKACRKDAENKKKVDSVIKGEIVCPLCGGTRHYSLVFGDETTSHLSTYCSNSGMLLCKWFTQ